MKMDILKRNLAPVTEESWALIKDEATEMLNTLLSARHIVHVEGPKGWDYAAVPTGRLTFPGSGKNGIKFGLRQAKPLIELRIPFELDIWELDNIVRGARDIDLDAMENAAKSLARFEDEAIFNGLSDAGIDGIKTETEYKPISYPKKVEDLPKSIAQGINLLQAASVEGPYAMLLSAAKWQDLTTCSEGYPLIRRIEEILNGPIVVSQNLKEGILLPKQTEDLVLTLGNDISIGYESHNQEKVKLYFTESFTFQVLDPAVAVILK
jgi:uncharacterized linocin/CFP29 family protein